MDIFITFVVSAAVGAVVGVLSGLLGIGGGTVLVPIFKLGFGMTGIGATATSLFTIIPTSVTGAITHVRNKTCIPVLGIAAGVGGAITSPAGVWLASISPEWCVMAAAALVIAYSAITMFRKAWKLKKAEAALSSSSKVVAEEISVEEEDPAKHSTKKLVLVGVGVGLLVGVVSGYVGVGGGFIMVPLFMQLLNEPMRRISGTSLIAVMILAIPATITQALMGNVDWIAGIAIAIGAVPGASFGARLVEKVPEVTLRFIFGGFLLVGAVLLILNQLNVF